MELRRLISHFVYRIEAKPGGGFIARATDPAVPPIEAATRAELQQKIQATIAARLSSEFGLKVPTDGSDFKLDFHIEHKPEGGFAIHSADPAAESIEVASHDDIASHVAEKLIGLAGKHLSPELAQALNTPGASADVKVVRAGKSVTINSGSRTINLNVPQDGSGSTAPAVDAGSMGDISNNPITPEAGGSSMFFKLLLALVVLGALAYVFLHYR